jgi:5-methylcytosine-specific restriction protein A
MTFIARSTGQAYMEGHHLIPMKYQSQFDCGIDVYANVVCLCPTCHRLLHFGRDPERRYAVEQLFDLRSERLIHSGIDLSKKDFLELVLA